MSKITGMSLDAIVQEVQHHDKNAVLTLRVSNRKYDREAKKAVFEGLFIRAKVWGQYKLKQVGDLEKGDRVGVLLTEIELDAYQRNDGELAVGLSGEVASIETPRKDQAQWNGGSAPSQAQQQPVAAPTGQNFPGAPPQGFPDDVPF